MRGEDSHSRRKCLWREGGGYNYFFFAKKYFGKKVLKRRPWTPLQHFTNVAEEASKDASSAPNYLLHDDNLRPNLESMKHVLENEQRRV